MFNNKFVPFIMAFIATILALIQAETIGKEFYKDFLFLFFMFIAFAWSIVLLSKFMRS